MSPPPRPALSALRALPALYAIPVALAYIAYGAWMTHTQSWHLLAERWHMTLTMVFGSFIAGATPEGGGAVAYPVMTLGFRVPPPVARDFSLLIQSVGMTAASLWILGRRVTIERAYLGLAFAGSVPGVLLGTLCCADRVSPPYAKLTFVSFWLSFGLALFWINHVRRRAPRPALPPLDRRARLELLAVGLLGGVLSAVYGNGVDICTFAYVTLRHNLSEEVATPTSVLLMASNALLGALLRGAGVGGGGGLSAEAWGFWLACVPVVLVGAPLGAYVTTRLGRLWVAWLLYALILSQLAAALLILRPTGALLGAGVGAFGAGALLFSWAARRAFSPAGSAAPARP
ncbi:MAG: sulfite exporter TauE/SafE family protein [Deltaproteobacteria bacterium]|nr:sulfite exporter TauE/SafE family protein [Deltaproteobacteria bacterium]